jgi:hypothetical protein
LLAIELTIGAGDDSRRNEDFEAPGEKAKLVVLPFLFEGEMVGWDDVSCA